MAISMGSSKYKRDAKRQGGRVYRRSVFIVVASCQQSGLGIGSDAGQNSAILIAQHDTEEG